MKLKHRQFLSLIIILTYFVNVYTIPEFDELIIRYC